MSQSAESSSESKRGFAWHVSFFTLEYLLPRSEVSTRRAECQKRLFTVDNPTLISPAAQIPFCEIASRMMSKRFESWAVKILMCGFLDIAE